MTEVWILLVTIWFNGAMNSYQVDFMSEANCEEAVMQIAAQTAASTTQFINNNPQIPEEAFVFPFLSATCVKDSWEEFE